MCQREREKETSRQVLHTLYGVDNKTCVDDEYVIEEVRRCVK